MRLLRSSSRPLLAREIAERLHVDRNVVNRALYGSQIPAVRDESFRWRIVSDLTVTSAEAKPQPPQTREREVQSLDSTHMHASRLGSQPAAQPPFAVGAAGVSWALEAFDQWVAAGRKGIAVARSERWATALLLVAIEDHLIAREARAAVVTTDQPLLLARILRLVSPNVQIGGLHRLLAQSAVTVYRLGADTRYLRGEAVEAMDEGPILLALLGCRGVGRTRSINHLEGPYQSRLAIDFPGPLLQSTKNLLRPWFGEPLPESPLQKDVLTDVNPSGARPNYSSARERELRALFGDDWQLDGTHDDGQPTDQT